MLGDNTNKIVWASVAVGLMSLISGIIMTIFPNFMTTIHDVLFPTDLAYEAKVLPASDWRTRDEAGNFSDDNVTYNADGTMTYDTRTPKVTKPSWLLRDGRKVSVPSGAKTVTMTVQAKGQTQSYVHAWIRFVRADGSVVSGDYTGINVMSNAKWASDSADRLTDYSDTPTVYSDYITRSRTVSVPKDAVAVYASLQTREGSVVTYKYVSIGFDN